MQPDNRSNVIQEEGNTHPPNPYSLAPPGHILVDLLELHDCGEPVVWPNGFSALLAKQFLEDYRTAVTVAYTYTPRFWSPPGQVFPFSARSNLTISRRVALDGIHPELRSGPIFPVPSLSVNCGMSPWPFLSTPRVVAQAGCEPSQAEVSSGSLPCGSCGVLSSAIADNQPQAHHEPPLVSCPVNTFDDPEAFMPTPEDDDV